jgi:hypothetical protein
MYILSILPFIWTLSTAWSPTGPDSWQLAAPASGTYTIEGCLATEIEDCSITYRHRQDLSGSGNNHSSAYFVFTSGDTLTLSAGETGSSDPLRIFSTSGEIDTLIHHTLFDFASPFDIDFTLKFSSDSSHLSLFAAHHSSPSIIHLADIPSVFSAFLCMGFSATCTSSYTEAFSFSLIDLIPAFTDIPQPFIIKHTVIAPECMELEFSSPPSSVSAIWRLGELGESPASISFNYNTCTLCGLPPLSDGIRSDIKI